MQIKELTKEIMVNKWVMPLKYTKLPYLNEKTLFLHYHKHHKGYANKLYDLLYKELGIEEDLDIKRILDIYSNDKEIYNNAAQVFNHNFYWESITDQYNENFDSKTYDFVFSHISVNQLIDKGLKHFGSGYLWLVVEKSDKLIKIITSHDAIIPNQEKYELIFCIDLWEHAYYLNYFNNRETYLRTIIEQGLNWKNITYKLQMSGILTN